ncbi:hypothetical protein ELG72_06120 [Rhizobium leguminosarum]|nr:hypothetical protein ELG82_06425 [Rhizobium leguminosarum]TBG20010.1 hypothetical protein ELG81_05415 [Rhizobium leguminosarum]TBG36487.1 hypothetical protein ELG78_05695 [Rhizobium leguminosarum]TBG45927.1 hypothetical protein ELG75_05425 [Rhizobium leguminosarum]TBG57842.1 hypothetical protein ELG71_05600 [Rhizobium leguminosarum]
MAGNGEVAAYPFAPRAGRRWRQPDEGRPRQSPRQEISEPARKIPPATPRSPPSPARAGRHPSAFRQAS